MKQRCLALLLIVPFLLASPAWALFDAQVLTGKRSTDFKFGGVSNTESGTELKVAAHLDPIPLVPVGFGLSLSQINWDKSDKLAYKSLDGFEVGLEVEAWLPIDLGGLQFYGKLGYTIAGAYVATAETAGQEYKLAYKPSGTYINVGAKYNFLFRLGVMLEVEQGTRELSFDEVKDLPAGIDPALFKRDGDATNTSFLLGVQAGL
ncbi:MAG TPA: hypothetical protein VE954_21500 [Oligoflexus sp.]|uniref:hypothetical protein n=1 Tax=Oligoflexus sp. TaxID=1971216 RepID=UPI002D6265A5|nr:hypothetical protein [Oligoflexus sp.]HYX35680.1 hypothetical protein [Oligoflexus sp.]